MTEEPHRLALVLADYRAVPPPGVGAAEFAAACLADSYEVLADLSEVRAGIGRPSNDAETVDELLWPGDLAVPVSGRGLRSVAGSVSAIEDVSRRPAGYTELLLMPADVPDLPGLVLAKVAKALHRADVCTAPELGGDGLVAFGVRLPWPGWLDVDLDLDLDHDRHEELAALAPRRSLVARVPGWHRMRRPAAVDRLDPGLEGWDQVRLLLSGEIHDA